MAASAYFDTVQKLYIAFYQRPADSAGLTYWAEQIDAANGNIEAAIQAFSTQEEALELYGEINEDTIGDVIDQIYFAAFGRYAEQEELDYWVPDFIAGNTTPSNIVLAVLLGAQGTDAASVNNKLEVANLFTSLTDGRDPTDPAFGTEPFAATYDGYDDVAAARDLLAGVTDDPDTILSPEDVTTAIVDTIADEGDAIIPVEPPPTFSLTADADSVDEGDTVTFTVEGGKANFTYNYELTGVDATDVKGGVLTGSVTTDADGNGTFEVTLAADRATDGADTLTATLPNTGLSASVTVNDTSLDNIAPVAVDATANAIEEGAVVTGQLEATDADDDALTFTLDAPLQGLTLNADGSYSFDPTQNDIVKALTTAGGSTDLVATYTVTDALGATDTGTLTITAAPAPLSFKLEAGATTVNEDGSITFTVTANEAVAAATDVVFTLVPGNSTAVDQGTATTNLNDFGQGAFNPVTVTIPANGTKATFTITPPNDDITELAESFSVQAVVGGQTLTATATLLDGSTGAGKTYMLTKGLDNVPGTAGNDTIIGSINAATGGNAELNTLSALDIINGGAGVDTLKIADADGGTTAIKLGNVSNVEIIEVQGAKNVNIDTSTTSGVTNLKVTGAVKDGTTVVDAVASATTDVEVAVKASAGTVKVDGGKNVTVKLADVAVVGDAVTIGAGTAGAAKGDVVVEMTGKAATAAVTAQGAVNVTGGKTISVTQKAVGDAAAVATSTTGFAVTQGAVNVIGNADTTTVTVKQDASVLEVAGAAAKAATTATQDVTFSALTKGQTAQVTFSTGNSLTFTANKALTAAEVASAFANLAASAKQGAAAASLGVYSNVGAGSVDGWTSGAVTTVSPTAAKVTFTTSNAAGATLTVGGTGVTTVAKVGTAAAATPAKAGVLGVINGKVTVDAKDVVKTISVDGYADATGASNVTNGTKLETLNLTNSGLDFAFGKVSAVAGFTVDKSADTLALNLEKVGFSKYYDNEVSPVPTTVDAAVTLTAAAKTLNVKSTGNNFVDLTANATETLNVSGNGVLKADLLGTPTLKAVKVTETAGLTLSGGDSSITSVDTTGTTGAVTVSIKGAQASYAGGAGVDKVTVTDNAVITKSINLGAGDDVLDLKAINATNLNAIASTNVLQGGAGTNTLVLAAADAATVTGGTVFETRISGFQKLELAAATAAQTVNLDNLNDINYVISNGGITAGTKAVYTLDLSTLVLGASGGALTIGGVTVATNPAAATTAGDLTLVPATVTIGGVVYNINKTTNTAVTLTAQTSVAAITGTVTTAVTGTGSTLTGAGAITATTPGTADVANVLTLDKMLANATVELKAAGEVEVKLKDATGTADVVNVVANSTAADLGKFKASKVETINVEAKDADTTTSVNATTSVVTQKVSTNALELNVDAAKTINLTGAGNLTVTLTTDSKEVTLIDGSTATGKLTVTTVAGDTAATTVKGGAADDTLTAQGANDVLLGGAGKDTLKVVGVAASAVTLTGGDGVDTFDVSLFKAASAGSAVTITDFTKGEVIKFATGTTANFVSSKVSLIGEATFDNYVTEAAKVADQGDTGTAISNGISWFQYGGNTFIVQDVNGNAAFDNNNDIIVKLTGLVDLSASSFNADNQGTLLFI
ncbi:MAG: hypothetical protein PHX69_03990 [Simplicispira sp.]|uniref:Ig-like domain-containing protein n=1 Tax=Simplicispira sp. TaxID=2015802 RepID=UPI00258D0F84|nr:hypothetical protein [Simplicispira sp.]MDD2690930.1 hypothetical protein [Simplicispira sp.]